MSFKIATQQRNSNRINRSIAKTASSTRVRPTGYHLQRTIGNSATSRFLKTNQIQPKLTVSHPADPYEREADRVAGEVMHMPEPQSGLAVQRSPLKIQRLCTKCEDDDLQRKPNRAVGPTRQEEEDREDMRRPPDEEKGLIQTKPASQSFNASEPSGQLKGERAQTPQVSPAVAANIHALKGSGSPLPQATRSFFEPRFGADFGQVRVHTDSRAAQTANSLNARAFTLGQSIAFGTGHYAPHSHEGRQLLAHELTHVVQQSGSAAAVQRAPQPAAPDPAAERAAAEEEALAAIRFTSEQLIAQSDAEDALKLKWSKRKDKNYAWSVGLKDRARLQKRIELSRELQQEIAVKIHFFSGEAKAAYIQTISPALTNLPSEQVNEIFAAPPGAGAIAEEEYPELTCEIAHQFPLEYEGEPQKTRCIDINTDPEFIKNYFDRNIKDADGFSSEGTTWENVEYDRFKIMLVHYHNGTSEYFTLDEIGNFYYGGKPHITLKSTFLKRYNGLIYPLYNGKIYSNEVLTPNLIRRKNGMQYQIKQLQELYGLLEIAGANAINLGAYGAGVGSFKTAIKAFRRSGPASLPGRPLPGRPKPKNDGVPVPISDEATTQRIRPGRVGEVVGDFEISGDKGLKGTTFERNIYGISNIHGPAPSKTLNIKPIMELARSFIQEAKAAGATQLRITGNVIRNENVFKLQGVVGHFGGTFRQTGPMEIEIIIPIR